MQANYWDDLSIRIPHEFEVEISLLVTENHRITLEAIVKSEDEEVDQINKEWIGEDDREIVSSQISNVQRFFDDLRRVANHSALVSLVTRLDHWARRFVRQLSLNTKKDGDHVVREIKALNARLGEGPYPADFFDKLVTARDSVIHGDSRGQWERRRVAPEYINAYGELDFTERHLAEAVDRVIQQVKWYDERITALKDA